MYASWRERIKDQPQLADIGSWPELSVQGIPKAKRKKYLRNMQVITSVLSGESFDSIALRHSLSIGRISQIMDRCLGGDIEAPPALASGCIPDKKIKKGDHLQVLPSLKNDLGTPHAFNKLIGMNPALRTGLDDFIIAKLKDSNRAQTQTPYAFHGEFKRLLAESNWPKSQYPYTSQNLAYETVRRYLHRRTKELILEHTGKKEKRAHVEVGSGFGLRSLRAVQIDEHMLDAHQSLYLSMDEQFISLRMARSTVLLATDVDTHCILGYHLAPTQHPNQQDLLSLWENCLSPWQPLELTSLGLNYTPGSMFPEISPYLIGQLQLDNAMSHRSASLISSIAKDMGASLHYGLPCLPTTRQLVEYAFNRINQKLSHRLPSTTGSHPRDSKRESAKNRKHPPVVTFQMFNEMLSVVLAHHNTTPQAALQGSSPIDVFNHYRTQHYTPIAHDLSASQWKPFVSSKVVALHWYKNDNRPPHINFCYVKYTGDGLWKALKQKDEKVRVEFDRSDIRTLKIYSLNGAFLGDAYPPKTWRRFAHSIHTRNYIHNLCKNHRLEMSDPLSSALHHLLKNKDHQKDASRLLRIYTEFSKNFSFPLEITNQQHSSHKKPKATDKAFKWQPRVVD